MKRMIAFLLALCLCVCLCACANESQQESESTTLQTEATEPTLTISEEQANAVQKSAQIHAFLDYDFSLDSVSYLSIEDDGTYITIGGEVVFADSVSNKYTGNYTIVLVEQNDSESPYKVVSWELDSLVGVLDESRDYFTELYDYIVQNGYYDSSEKSSYIEVQIAKNEYYYLFAVNDTFRFWDIASYEDSESKFFYLYECTLSRDAEPYFSFSYGDFEISYGVAVDGVSVKATGNIDALGEKISLPLLSEECVNCDIKDYYQYIYNSQKDCEEFVESIINDAKLGITYEQLFG